jgi:hypothetical protein
MNFTQLPVMPIIIRNLRRFVHFPSPSMTAISAMKPPNIEKKEPKSSPHQRSRFGWSGRSITGVALQISPSFVLNNPGNCKGLDDPDDVDDPFPSQG